MKAITICQPHAWAIFHGGKRFENREWYSKYRGPLLIHAGKSKEWLGAGYPEEPHAKDLTFGALIGAVEMVACVSPRQIEARDGKLHGYANPESAWCHEYAAPILFEKPYPCAGALSLWEVPTWIADAISIELMRRG